MMKTEKILVIVIAKPVLLLKMVTVEWAKRDAMLTLLLLQFDFNYLVIHVRSRENIIL